VAIQSSTAGLFGETNLRRRHEANELLLVEQWFDNEAMNFHCHPSGLRSDRWDKDPRQPIDPSIEARLIEV
jgi:hypothetical protein